jgi:hypothetical protein
VSQEIEELGDLLTQLTAEQEELKQQHMTMHTKAAALQAEQDSSLQQALAKNAEQQDKLSTAEVRHGF